MIYLGLGSNQRTDAGGRRQLLSVACQKLEKAGFEISRSAPVIETPALLPEDAPSAWNRPYLNTALEGRTVLSPEALLSAIKDIEREMGRDTAAPRWSPRPIDIDILAWDHLQHETDTLRIPHPAAHQRSFVLTPLLELNPALLLNGKSLLEHSRSQRPLPLWMGIINATPDSFSDAGWFNESALENTLSTWLDAGVPWLDLGAESTRPNGEAIPPRQEWQRLKPVIDAILSAFQANYPHSWLRPRLSIDTRNADTAERALKLGADAINDVTGLVEPRLRDVIRDAGCTAIAMHSLSVPVVPNEALPTDEPIVAQITHWMQHSARSWERAGLQLDKLLIDPGIGFGKTPLQNWTLLQHAGALRDAATKLGCRLLIGHSRKSFFNDITPSPFADRDLETLGASIALAAHGVDMIRVHEPLMHMRAHRAWVHARL